MASFSYLEPWVAVEEQDGPLVNELNREVCPGHPLHGAQTRALARRIDQNDVLFELLEPERRVAVVHLTWKRENDPRWPHAVLLPDLDNWANLIMKIDHEEYVARSEAMGTTVLFRPVGEAELALIEASGWREFPPRLPEQPIFYPVLNERYAAEIALKWNTKDPASGFVGFVTRFAVRTSYLERFEIQTVGASHHQEYWIPAEELASFNRSIVGRIEIIQTYRRDDLDD